MTGTITCLMSGVPCRKWIVDSGATHHISSSLSLLEQGPSQWQGEGDWLRGRWVICVEDTARALRFQGGFPLKYWGVCVKVAVYLINRMPSDALNGHIPFELLYKKKKRYILMNIKTSQFFVSRDVSFREVEFPFLKGNLESTVRTANDVETWNLMDTTQVAPAPLEQSDVHVLVPDDSPAGTTDASTYGVHDNTHVVADAGCASPTDDSNIEGTAPAYTRKSTRRAQEPVWLKDYVTTKKANLYSLSNYLSYYATSPKYKAYLANFSTLVEPKCFNEAVHDIRWVEAMKL
ncbi:uncharacterized protein LOC125834372 [Solanum verrucosum]|uniref:uncharacterized protein LOC125834372 n=1 Tax=Solanum verrucosum TaxID=315347 RepID=UPI0020D19180|nr:uncharacterized protein LOC125834372 [Solanum verrucosum]